MGDKINISIDTSNLPVGRTVIHTPNGQVHVVNDGVGHVTILNGY